MMRMIMARKMMPTRRRVERLESLRQSVRKATTKRSILLGYQKKKLISLMVELADRREVYEMRGQDVRPHEQSVRKTVQYGERFQTILLRPHVTQMLTLA